MKQSAESQLVARLLGSAYQDVCQNIDTIYSQATWNRLARHWAYLQKNWRRYDAIHETILLGFAVGVFYTLFIANMLGLAMVCMLGMFVFQLSGILINKKWVAHKTKALPHPVQKTDKDYSDPRQLFQAIQTSLDIVPDQSAKEQIMETINQYSDKMLSYRQGKNMLEAHDFFTQADQLKKDVYTALHKHEQQMMQVNV